MINPNRLSDADLRILGAYAHYAGLEKKDEIDEEILGHLREAWSFILKRDEERLDARTKRQKDRDERIDKNAGKNPF